jgi:ribosomal-protein-alanine N-acetyltransferase
MFPVYLRGSKVDLREFTLDDVDAAYRIVGDDAVTHWLSFASRSHTEAAKMVHAIVSNACAEERTEYYLAIDLDGDLIGFIRLALSGVRAAKLGYAVRADQWGSGYATTAARMILNFAFHDLRLHRVSAAIGPDNRASVAVVKRLGFSYEGRIRDHVWTNNRWRDSLLYSLLDNEWKSMESTPDSSCNAVESSARHTA